MSSAPQAPAASRARGSILVSTLWLLLFLAFLAMALRMHVAHVGQSARLLEETAGGRFLAGSALDYAVALIRAETAGAGGADVLSGTLETASGSAAIEITNEAARIDLNTAPAPLIIGLLSASGVSPVEAARLADAIVGMRPADPALEEPVFTHAAELAELASMPPSVAINAARWATVSSGLAAVRLDALPRDILEAVPGLPTGLPALVEGYRDGTVDREELDRSLAGTPLHATGRAPAWRLLLRVEPVSGRPDAYGAVIVIPPDATLPHQVVEWRRIDVFDSVATSR
jgi:general secretion pathway protein K